MNDIVLWFAPVSPAERIRFILGEEDDGPPPPQLFTELDELLAVDGQEMEWKETARWASITWWRGIKLTFFSFPLRIMGSVFRRFLFTVMVQPVGLSPLWIGVFCVCREIGCTPGNSRSALIRSRYRVPALWEQEMGETPKMTKTRFPACIWNNGEGRKFIMFTLAQVQIRLQAGDYCKKIMNICPSFYEPLSFSKC